MKAMTRVTHIFCLIFAVFLIVTPAVYAEIANLEYVLSDHLGTAVMVIDEDGNQTWPVAVPVDAPAVPNEVMPFGRDIETSHNESNYKLNFTNKEIDSALQLHYFGARYYHSGSCRFISPDPVGGTPENPISFNRYLYCRNDPVNLIDPDGELEQYFMTLNSQQTTNLDHYKNSGQYTMLTSSKVFSGNGQHRNNPNSTGVKGKGPLPKGTWYIVDRPSSSNVLRKAVDSLAGKNEWFALFKKDGKVDDKTVVQTKDGEGNIESSERSNIRFHPGAYSEGCLTFENEEEFEREADRLSNTETETIPGTDIKYYGTIEVQ